MNVIKIIKCPISNEIEGFKLFNNLVELSYKRVGLFDDDPKKFIIYINYFKIRTAFKPLKYKLFLLRYLLFYLIKYNFKIKKIYKSNRSNSYYIIVTLYNYNEYDSETYCKIRLSDHSPSKGDNSDIFKTLKI